MTVASSLKSLALPILAAAAALVAPTAGLAADPFFMGLGVYGTAPAVGSRAIAISADGTSVIGIGGSSVAGENFRWTAATGAVFLGTLEPPQFARAQDISGDGSVIVGFSPSPIANNEAFKWTLTDPITGAGTMIGLGDLPGGQFPPPNPGEKDRNNNSFAYAVSDDGTRIIGAGSGPNGTRAISFSGGVGLDLGYGENAAAGDISGDGKFVAGVSLDADDKTVATRFGFGGGSEIIGFVPGRESLSNALAISRTGAVVVGDSRDFPSREKEAFHWISGEGILGLGDLPGGDFSSRAEAVSGNGSVVVGTSITSSTFVESAFIWDEENGMRDLRKALIQEFGIGVNFPRLQQAVGISADGRTIVGTGLNSSNQVEAWMAYLGPPGERIEIRPFSDVNFVNPLSSQPISVALLGSDDLDITNVDLSTLGFGPFAAASKFDLTNPWILLFSQWDANNDGIVDLVTTYRTDDTGIGFDDTEACLTGQMLDSTPFEICDDIVICGDGLELALLVPIVIWGPRRWRRKRSRTSPTS